MREILRGLQNCQSGRISSCAAHTHRTVIESCEREGPSVFVRAIMHSAVTIQQCRFCGRSTTGGNVRPKLLRLAPRRRVAPKLSVRASSFVDHADSQSRSSESHDKSAKSDTAKSDTVAVTARPIRQRKLDKSLPYVAVLRATKEHRHPVQEQQRALGMVHLTAGISCDWQTLSCAAMLQRITCDCRQASTLYLMHKR